MKKSLILFIIMGVVCSLSYGGATTINEKTKNLQEYPGYFPFYWEAQTGKIWLAIDKFDQEFLYVHSLPAGLGSNDVGLDRNQLGRTRIVKFHRVGPKILLVQPNYAFRALSDSPDERLAVQDAFAESVLWGFRVEAEEKGRVLVDATDFFMRDAHDAIGTLRRRQQGNFKQDLTRSVLHLPNTKNFPLNTEVEVMLTFTTVDPGGFVRQVAPDPHTITLRQRHSFIQLPDDGYRPREYDPRSNFFSMEYMDFATPISEPIAKRFIARHRLVKKDPRAKISDPVKPIVYYVDRGVPEPIRSALVEGASWWNEAFEAVGYRNAFQAKVLPEGADPMDIRYNMINWVHRSTRGWSYGATVSDPRTGEIIKGHVALGSQRLRQDFLIAQGLIGNYEEGKNNSAQMTEMALARIRQLSCHEVGHAIGMGHNYASSVNDRASVMDYPHPLVLIREDGLIDLSDAYDVGVGEWDKVSIAFGYQHFPDDVDEEKELKAILDRAFSRGLYFLDSQDAGPTSAHPLANTWDNGKHPVDELERMMTVRAVALDTFSENRIPMGTPMATLEGALVPVYFFHRYQIEAAASVIGGLYYNHTLRGDVQADPKIVDGAEQRRALHVLLQAIEPGNLVIPEDILKLIPPKPPGYRPTREMFKRYTGMTLDPLGAAEALAHHVLGLILHPERTARLVDYHSRNVDYPGLTEVLGSLIEATWKSPVKLGVHAEIQRVVNTVLLYHTMHLVVHERSQTQVRAIAFSQLDELREWLTQQIKVIQDKDQRSHYVFALSEIARFQEDPQEFRFVEFLIPPPGAPIGTEIHGK
ncbi:zinc-dependent metalloprotease [Acidobacteriota bacterium]